MPHFAPVRVRGGRHPLQRLLRHRRRAVAAGLAVTAAALVAAGPHTAADTGDGRRARGHPVTGRPSQRPVPRMVSAPVRIADGETVRLLRPGDRVDVVATGAGVGSGPWPGGAGGAASGVAGGAASVIARGVRVAEVPEILDPGGTDGDGGVGGVGGAGGALVVLSVPRETAARLVGAGAESRLAVTLC
ncbi:hypothetical protein J7I94_07780 [Streptomyces sp. ISL-12]|uniref:hypothetical protein n=1 Tax=Streptomyces sp. ISL-12 TaxID=2819177 RepID=UPI001BE655B4|nr:hypothetical protein [Streptomyces sp. ISL-12]MBT2410459.1 hypothetical protein [Streptomyces sp. ISL-12]